jgi:multiple antibiotic resistance protein
VIEAKLLVYLLVMINPFAQLLYLWDLLQRMRRKDFASAYWRASLLSLGVFLLFATTGDFLFVRVFQVRLDAFRIFGGLVMLLVAYRSLREGAGSNLLTDGKSRELAPQLALPFLVGPGTIWVSIRLGQELPPLFLILGMLGVLFLNFAFVVTIHRFVSKLEGYRETLAGQYLNLLMRTNALFVGAIAVEMILSGVEGAYKTRGFMP